jgi:MerR family transcriptional regulator/heat shock protein HspR
MKGYPIGVAVGLTGTSMYTLRAYERLGLVKPARTSGGIRAYSDFDIARVRFIKHLTLKVHVNVVGVEVILGMVDRMAAAQSKLAELGKLLEQAPLYELEEK